MPSSSLQGGHKDGDTDDAQKTHRHKHESPSNSQSGLPQNKHAHLSNGRQRPPHLHRSSSGELDQRELQRHVKKTDRHRSEPHQHGQLLPDHHRGHHPHSAQTRPSSIQRQQSYPISQHHSDRCRALSLQRQHSYPAGQFPSDRSRVPSEHGQRRRSLSCSQPRPASCPSPHGDLHGRATLAGSGDNLSTSQGWKQRSPHYTPSASPVVKKKTAHFTPPPSPGLRQKSPHASPSLQAKSHHILSAHAYRNGKKSYSPKSESPEEEKCLPQMESIMRQMASGKVTTDSLVNNFGGCGPFQVLLVMATYSAQIAAVWGMMFMAYGNYHPKWWCYDDVKQATAGNLSFPDGALKINASADQNVTSGSGDRDSERASLVGGSGSAFINPATGGVWSIRPWDPKRSNQTGTCSTFKKCRHVEFDEVSSTVASEWGLICEEAWSQSAIISIQMTGVLVGACLGGFIGDRRGRKTTLYGHLFFLAVFNIVAIFSPTWQMFTFCRFLIGACVGAILACCILYPMEFVDVWWRGVLGALPVWNVGATSFSLAVWLLKDWKQLHIATAVLSICIFLPVFWVPESMRWLAVHGKVDEAKYIANKIASMNRRTPPNTTVLEIIAKEEKRMSRIKGTYSKYTVLDLFADRFIRRISIRMGFIWCCMSAVYYALSFGIKNFSGDFYINFIAFSAAEVPGMLFVAPATNKLGRRLGSVVYFASGTVCCAAVVVISFAASGSIRGSVITVLAMLARMHILAVWMMVTVFCTELYPTVIRNLSIGYLNACARVGGIAAPFLLPNSSDFLFISFIIMGGLMVLCCYLLKTLPETKGRPLEDTIKARSHLSIIVEETELEVRTSESA
ncbi:solute carrier family 22 member 21 [Plakobranchus ocellatus]|uniref:Solute carrier family 22 member 21 n=1 Tax=Plakobranchus ocellatus TaxID=259542 RepID=A0AAV4BAJ7_9GAST|nr:solute carrier family 22 member 21 [Plakobranchus ocellatus]